MKQSFIDSLCKRSGIPDLPGVLAERLSPSALNSLLLEVFHRQTAQTRPPALLAAYRQNRFVQPAAVDALAFRAFELRWLRAGAEAGFLPLELSPVSPLGACSAFGAVHQDKVLSALRGAEVQADATNALALESAVQRRALGFPALPLSYCAAHRHLRTQRMDFPGFTPHFGVFCLSAAGRDTGSFQFEQEQLSRHIRVYLRVLQELVPAPALKISLVSLLPQTGKNSVFDAVYAHLCAEHPEVPIETQQLAQARHAYYHRLRFGILLERRGKTYPIIDGGLTTWTQQLTNNRKERFLGSGVGLEFLWKLLDGRI